MSTYCPPKQGYKETGTSVTEPTSCRKEICRVYTILSHWFPQPNPSRPPGSSCGLPCSDSRQQSPVVQTQALPSLAPRTMSQECTEPSRVKGWVFVLWQDQGQEKRRTEPLGTETCIQMSIIQELPFNFTRWLLGTCQGPRRVLPGSEWSLALSSRRSLVGEDAWPLLVIPGRVQTVPKWTLTCESGYFRLRKRQH